MAARKPLVIVSGQAQELPAADTLETANIPDLSGSYESAGAVTTHETTYNHANFLTTVAAADISDATADGIALITAADANPFTDAQQAKLTGIEESATADQTGAEIEGLLDTELANTDWKLAVGTGAGTVAAGDHTHAGVYEPADADIAKTDTANTWSAQQTFSETAETSYSLTGTALDPSNGGIQYKTLAANTTFTDSLTDGQSIMLRFTNASTYTVTWPTISAWIGGEPTWTDNSNLAVFWKEGTSLYAVGKAGS